jgi:hypothetical protein
MRFNGYAQLKGFIKKLMETFISNIEAVKERKDTGYTELSLQLAVTDTLDRIQLVKRCMRDDL